MGSPWRYQPHCPHVNPAMPLLPVCWGRCCSPELFCPYPLSSQHFVCAKCEKPFLGHRHYEKKGLAYCETHYNQVRPGAEGGRAWRGDCLVLWGFCRGCVGNGSTAGVRVEGMGDGRGWGSGGTVVLRLAVQGS